MINERMGKYIEGQIRKRVSEGEERNSVIDFEIMKRNDTIRGLVFQKQKDEDEIEFLKSLKEERE